MYYPNYQRLNDEFSHNAIEEPGYMIDVSVTRASALMDAAYLYEVEGNKKYVPNGKFSDAELTLFELFCRAFRVNRKVN